MFNRIGSCSMYRGRSPQPRLQREQARSYLDLSTTSFVVAWPESGGTLAEMVLLAFADLYQLFPSAWLFVDCDPRTNAVPAAVATQANSFGIASRICAQRRGGDGRHDLLSVQTRRRSDDGRSLRAIRRLAAQFAVVDARHARAGRAGRLQSDCLVVQHMDARRLRFPDNRFDGIFSSGLIEHFGGLMDVAHSAYEMGRVLKPGGILSLSTVMAIAGPPGRLGGVPGTCSCSSASISLRYIVEASGLELVDALDTDATPAAHAVHRSLEQVLTAVLGDSAARGLKGLQEDYKHGVFPCIALDWKGFTFDSVHLALRKPLSGCGAANAWARPTPVVDQNINEDYRRVIEDYGASAPSSTVFVAPVDCWELPTRRRLARRRGCCGTTW